MTVTDIGEYLTLHGYRAFSAWDCPNVFEKGEKSLRVYHGRVVYREAGSNLYCSARACKMVGGKMYAHGILIS